MGVLMRSEDDWQQQLDEVVALASILDKDFTVTAGPGVTGDAEQDLTSLALAQPCSERLQCTATVRATLPSGIITIKVCFTSPGATPATNAGTSVLLTFPLMLWQLCSQFLAAKIFSGHGCIPDQCNASLRPLSLPC